MLWLRIRAALARPWDTLDDFDHTTFNIKSSKCVLYITLLKHLGDAKTNSVLFGRVMVVEGVCHLQ